MTNHDLHELFKIHGNILSVSIKTEVDTGRGKGFGFVTFETEESAASAIQHLNGYQIHGKRLKVDYKKLTGVEKISNDYRYLSHSGFLPPHQDFGRPSYEPRQLNYHQPPESGFVPIQVPGGGGDVNAALGSLRLQEARAPQSRESDGYIGVLPPLTDLTVDDDADTYVGSEEDKGSTSGQFADLSDIGVALPDIEPSVEYD